MKNFVALGTRRSRRLAVRRVSRVLVLLSVLGMQFAPVAWAGNLYWDTNDVADGSGAATGNWGSGVFWNTDPTGGAGGSFTASTGVGDDLFFSAGTNGTTGTVTVSTGQSADSITFQNNVAVTLSGGSMTLGGGSTPGIFVLSGDNAANVISTPITLSTSSGAFNFTNNGTGLLTVGAITGSTTAQVLNVSSASTGGVTLNGIIGGNVSVAVNNTGGGATTLSGANTYTGGTTITGGKVVITSDANLGALTGPLTIDGGTLQENTGFNMSASRQVIIGASGATFNVNQTSGNFNIGGVIKDAAGGGGALNITGTGTTVYVPVAQNTYTGGTHLMAGTTSVANSDSIGSASTGNLVSGPYGTGTLYLDGGKMRAPTGATGVLIGNAIQMTADTQFVTGSTNVFTLTGPVQLVGGTRTITQSSAADVVLSGAITDGGNGYGLTVVPTSTGSLVLGGVSTYSGPTTINAGNLVLNATGDITNSMINVGTAGTGGTFTVKGSHTFSGLTVGGNATAASAGTLNMLDNSISTITLNSATPEVPVLVLGGASAGAASNLNFDLGASGTDKIALGAGAQATINPGGARINVNVLGGYTGASSTLISSPTTDLTAGGPIALDTTTGSFGGFVLNATTTANAVTLTGTKLVATTPDTLYFKGSVDGKWNGFAGGNLNNSNWTTDAAGTVDAHTSPAANTDVHFSAAGFTAANQSTTLNQDFSIKSLTMDAGATTAVTIAPGVLQPGTLTIASGGITSQAGAAALTVSAPIVLGSSSQTITNNSASTITASGGISGTTNLNLTHAAGATGQIVISGPVNINGTIIRDATDAPAQDIISGAIGAGVTAITQNNPNATSSLVLDGNNTALNAPITINGGRLDGRNLVAGNTIRAYGTGGIFLNAGTLDARALGTASYQTVVTGDGVTGNNVTVGGNATIDVQRPSGSNVGSAIVFNNLAIGANTLNVTGTNGYTLNIAGNTTLSGAATLNPTTAAVTLLGKVTDNGNNLAVSGTAVTRLRNTAGGAGANTLGGTLNLTGVVQGFVPAAGAVGAATGSNSLGTATIALNSSAAVLRLTPSFDGGLSTPASAGVIDKSFVSGTTFNSLAATNFLGATAPIIQGTTPGQSTAGGVNPTGVQTVSQINIASALTATQASHQFTGLINITNAGMYNFQSFTDDGGNLFIDGNAPVVTANTTVANSFYLTAGLHTLTSRWNNNAGNGGDVVSYQGPDTANALVVVPASVLSNTTATAMAANFGNNVTIAAGAAPTIDIAANTTLGSLTMVGTGAGTNLNVTGSGDVNTLTFNGAVTLTDNFTLTDPTAHVVFNNGLMAAAGGPNNLTVTKNGFGTLTINGPVTTTGGFIVNGGMVNVTGTGTVGGTGAPVTLNGGVIDLGGTSQNIGAISGTGTIQNGTLTQGTLLKQGPGTVTLGLSATPTAVVVNQGLAGTVSNPATFSTLKLDFSNAFSPGNNIVNPAATLTLGGSANNLVGGGVLALQGKASSSNSQTFASTLVDGGASGIALTAGTGGSVVLNAGAITRNVGGTVDFTLPATASATSGVITSSGTDGQILTTPAGTAFATVGGNSWAAKSASSPGNIVDLAVAGAGGASGYTAATGTTFTGNADITGATTAASDSTVNSIRFNTGAFTLTLAGKNTVSTGGILFGGGISGVSAITGGTIVPGSGQELVVITNKANTIDTIASVFADGASGPTTVTYRGNPTGTTGGLVDIKANNTYTGPTYITSGRVATQSTAVTTPFGTGPNAIVYVDGNNDGQFFSNLNTTIANPFVIIGNGLNENGTRSGAIRLNSTSAITPTLSGPITLMGDASIGNTSAITGAGSALISGQIGTSNAAGATSFTLTKVSAGVIRLTNANNGQTATNINAGALNINSDGALGLATAPITFTGSGTLQLAAAQAVAAGRNIVLSSGTGSIDNGLGTAGASTTISGVISGPGAFAKAYATQSGAINPLILSGANTFTGNVTATSGWLVATNSQSFGLGTKTISAVTNTSSDSIHLDPGNGPAIDLPATMSFNLSNDGQGLYLLGNNDGTVVNDSGNNTIRGAVTLNSGGGATILASKAGTITFTGNVAPSVTGRALKLRGDGAGVISGVIANGTTVDLPVTRELGTGTWTLGGANTYTGTTTVQSGTVKVGHASALGGVGLTAPTTDNGTNVTGGTLDLNGTSNVNEVIRLGGTGQGGNGALVNSGAPVTLNGGTIASLNSSAITGGLGTAPTVTISGGGGTGATATASLGVTASSFTIAGGTTVYSAAPTVAISGGGGTGATATATLTGGVVSSITITNSGTGFTSAPTIAFSGGTVTTAGTNPTGTGNATNFNLAGYAITNAGTGYTSAPTATFTTSAGNNTTVTTQLAGVVLTGDSSIGGTGDITVKLPITETSGPRALTKVGTNTLNLAGNNAYTGPTVVSGGKLSVTGSIANSSGVTVGDASATFEAASAQMVKSLTVSAGQARVVSPTKIALTVGDGTQSASQLSLTGGKLDLTTNGVAIHYAAGADNDAAVLASTRAQIIAGFGPGGDWKGTTGITSSSIGSLQAIGYALASEVLPFDGGATTDTFLGTTVDKNTVVARYTLSGDLNLDGAVDFLDLARLAQSYNVTDGTRQWTTGDVNYDGNTDFLDLAKMAQNYNTALPSEPIPGAPAEFQADLARAFAAVPEPGTISLLGIGVVALLGRRRNRKAA